MTSAPDTQTETPTPRTDAELGYTPDGEYVPADFARTLERELAQARAELRAAQRDAERYRWLRSAGWFDDAIMEREHMNELFPETIDRAIDAAMSAGRGEEA